MNSMRRRFPVMLVRAVIAALLIAVSGTDAAAQIVVDINVLPTPSITGALSIQRVELVFGNDRPTATVAVNSTLKARAHIRYTGNGALTGQWLVDGRPIQSFNRTLTFGDSIMLETADLPSLPTFEPGTHEVTLNLNSPAVATLLPSIRYTVESAPGASLLTLVQPLDGAVLVRPRTDGLAVGKSSAGPLRFSWRAPVLTSAAPLYKFRVFVAGSESQPLASATTISPNYEMPAAVATALPMDRELSWHVQLINEQGRLLATSEARRMTLQAPSAIRLLSPVGDAAAGDPLELAWSASGKFGGYEARGYASEAAINKAQEQGDFSIGAQAGLRESPATARAAFSAISDQLKVTVSNLDPAVAIPGSAMRWLVLGLDGQSRVRDVSEVGDFHLKADLKTLNGLPVSFSIAGFEVSVDSYAQGATLASLSGRGTVRFARDRAQRAITLDFSDLHVEPYIEQIRQVTGSGSSAQVVVQEVLKGRVTGGRIAQTFATPVALDISGYPVSLRALTLAQDANGARANADLDIQLAGYADAAGASPARVPMTAVALEAGGDFFAEVPAYSIDALRSVSPLMPGLTLRGGRLIADFSLSRDFTGADGQPVRRDAGVFIMGGDASLAAAALLPVVQPQILQLGFDALELAATGYSGAFTVTGSEAIMPVVPAGYRVTFTGGRFVIDRGTLVASSLYLDGVAALPSSVRSASGLPPSAHFTRLHPAGDVLESASVQISEIEWGPSGGVPFRLSNAAGKLRLPYRVAGSAATGMRLTAGKLQSPMQFDAEVADAPVVSATPLKAPSAVADMLASGVDPLSGKLVDGVDLWVRTAGVSGEIASSARHVAKVGDFAGGITSLALSFTDSAVTRSRLDGEIVVPKPAGFKLGFTGASITGSGEIVGAKIVMPAEIMLETWRAKLLMPAHSTGKGKNIRTDTVPAITLSRSYLRFADTRLQFLLDPIHGPVEFDEIGLGLLDVGADGQVQASALNDVNSKFLQMGFVADSASALHFLAPGGDAAAGVPLITIDGNLAFPTLGTRHVTLAHTASGARADNLTPNGGGFGNPDYLRYDAANLAFHNGYTEGKGAYKEFLGTAQVGVLKTLTLGGLMEIGADIQGNYERVGLGIGVDAVRAASLYASGPVTIGAKLGAAAVNTATGGRSTAETEVAKLIGSSAELASESDPKKRVEKLIQSLSDALALAQRIHGDSGGKDDDAAGTSLAVTKIALTSASAIVKSGKGDSKQVVLAIADALDLALPLVAKVKTNGQLLPQDARNALQLARLAVKATRAEVDDGKLSQKEWLEITDQLLVAAGGFSNDRGYQLVVEMLKGWVEVARSARENQNDDTVAPRLAASTLKTLRMSGLVTDSTALDAMVLSQALMQGAVNIKDMPAPNNIITLAQGVLDAAAGPDTRFGGGAVADEVKHYLKLAQRTLELGATVAGGIPYDKAGRAVQATLHASGGDQDPIYGTIDSLVTSWVLVDNRPLSSSIAELQNLIICSSNPLDCSDDNVASLVANAMAAIGQAQTPEDLLASLRRLGGLRSRSIVLGTGDVLDDAQRTAIVAKALSVQNALLQKMSAEPVRYKFDELSGLYLGIEQALTRDLEIPGGSGSDNTVIFSAKKKQFLRELLTQLKFATNAEQAEYSHKQMLGVERGSQLLGFDVDGKNSKATIETCTAIATTCTSAEMQAVGLKKYDELVVVSINQWTRATEIAKTSREVRDAREKALAYERGRQLLGFGSSSVSSPAVSPEDRYQTLLQKELLQQLAIAPGGIIARYNAIRDALSIAGRVEDTDEAVKFYHLLALAAVPSGETAAQRDGQRTELLRLFREKGPALLGDALSRLRTADTSALMPLSQRYFDVVGVLNAADNTSAAASFNIGAINAVGTAVAKRQADFVAVVDEWLAEAPRADCASWQTYDKRLLNPALAFAGERNDQVRTVLHDLYGRCAAAEGAAQVKLYRATAGDEFNTLSKFIKELPARQQGGQPEAYLKEELAYQLAMRIRALTQSFSKGRDSANNTLGRVHDQTDYFLRNRQAPAPVRVIAAIRMISGPLMEQPGVPQEIREELQRLDNGLARMAANLAAGQKRDAYLAVDLAMSMASAHAPAGLPRAAINLASVGLSELRRPANTKRTLGTPAMVGLMAIAGVRAAGINEVAGIALPSGAEHVVGVFSLLDALADDSRKMNPIERLDAVMAFINKAGNMPSVGRYVMPLMRPADHLLAPDISQQDHFTDMILAELGVARNDNPVNVQKAFKSTCPAFSMEQGVQWVGSPNPNDMFVCAVDVAREVVMNNLKGAVDPLSPAGQAQRARTVVAGMKRETVFAKTSGDDTLSGISGLLEYRNGAFSRFDLISTYGLAGQFEVASKVSYGNRLLTIEQASNDSRDSGLLATLGLAGAGTNRLFGSDIFGSPVKYMLVQVGGPGSCFNMTADIGMDTPLGGVSTGRQGIATCFNPFGFDFGLTGRAPVAGIQVEARTRLFFVSGSGGLDMGTTIGVYPTAFGYGLFLDALTDLGIGAGVSGIEACGRVAVRAGATSPASGPSACPADFVPNDPGKPNGAGVCRNAASLGADIRAGNDYRNFFVKSQAGIGLPLDVYLGGWTYAAKQNDGGFGAFPANRYGGFTGVTSLNCGRL